MKILQIIPSLSSGGAERFTVDLCNELSKNNSVYLLTFRDYIDSDFYRPQISEQVKQVIYRGNYSILSKIWQLFVVTYYLIKIRPSVIHTHDVAIFYAVIYAFLFRRVKVFYTVHNLADKDTNSGISAFLRKKVLKNRIHAVSISETCRRSFNAFYGYDSFCTIENGCRELSLSNEIDKVQQEVRGYCNSLNTKVYICVARIVEAKNHKMLIDAFNRMAERGDDFVLLLIGKYINDSELKKKLDASIKTKNIRFLGTRTNVPDYLACADFFCLSSLWEGLPISVLEAGLSGCYPICTPAGGVVDVLKDEKWGVLSKGMSSEKYIEAVDHANKIKPNRDALISLYRNRYMMEKCAKEYLNLYRQ